MRNSSSAFFSDTFFGNDLLSLKQILFVFFRSGFVGVFFYDAILFILILHHENMPI